MIFSQSLRRDLNSVAGVMFSTLFTNRLTDNMGALVASVPPEQLAQLDPAGLTPAAVHSFPEALKQGVIDAYADALAPSFWYLVPLLVLGFVLSLFLREVRLSHEAGMVARGEAVAG